MNMSGVEEGNKYKRSRDRNQKEKEKGEKRGGLERVRVGSEEEGKVNGTKEY